MTKGNLLKTRLLFGGTLSLNYVILTDINTCYECQERKSTRTN